MEDYNYNIHLGDGVREARSGKASASWFGPKEESQREGGFWEAVSLDVWSTDGGAGHGVGKHGS